MRPSRTTTRSGAFGTALEASRAGYGAVQLVAPALLARSLLGQPVDGRVRAVARLLGARHLTQAFASGFAPSPAVLALGVEVDLLHAVSMIVIGGIARSRRKVALADGLLAVSFAAAGAAARYAVRRQPEVTPGVPEDPRQALAHRLACVLVPGYRARDHKPPTRATDAARLRQLDEAADETRRR